MSNWVRIDWGQKRVWILRQRIHHGPWAITCGTALLIWGLSDLHDLADWFRRGAQL